MGEDGYTPVKRDETTTLRLHCTACGDRYVFVEWDDYPAFCPTCGTEVA
jgi:uncharacterized protein (DUF983 family)